jgi:hypothetical protein
LDQEYGIQFMELDLQLDESSPVPTILVAAFRRRER